MEITDAVIQDSVAQRLFGSFEPFISGDDNAVEFSARTRNKCNSGGSSGFIEVDNVGRLPDGEWTDFLTETANSLRSFRVEILPRDHLVLPAPDRVPIPTVFDGPYFVFDTLFYWSD